MASKDLRDIFLQSDISTKLSQCKSLVDVVALNDDVRIEDHLIGNLPMMDDIVSK